MADSVTEGGWCRQPRQRPEAASGGPPMSDVFTDDDTASAEDRMRQEALANARALRLTVEAAFDRAVMSGELDDLDSGLVRRVRASVLAALPG